MGLVLFCDCSISSCTDHGSVRTVLQNKLLNSAHSTFCLEIKQNTQSNYKCKEQMINQNKSSVTTPVFNHILQFTLSLSYKTPSAVVANTVVLPRREITLCI